MKKTKIKPFPIFSQMRIVKEEHLIFSLSVFMAVVSLIYALLLYNIRLYFEKYTAKSFVRAGMKTQAHKWKEKAEFVIVGVILNIEDADSARASSSQSFAVLTVRVEAVERGQYAGDTIAVHFGWQSNQTDQLYMRTMTKKGFRKGDRVRLYVNFDLNKNSFYTPASYYTAERVTAE